MIQTMKRRFLVVVSFALGLMVGLFFMFYLCDHIFGRYLDCSRTKADTSLYHLEVTGGIVSKVTSSTVNIMATSLSVSLRVLGKKEDTKRSVVLEINNLPKNAVVSHSGAGEVYAGGDSVIAVVSLGKGSGAFQLSTSLPEPKGEFTFFVGGDNRDRLDLLMELFKRAHKEKPLFVVLGGDLVKTGLWWEYNELLELLEDFPVPVFAVPGNHDLEFCGRRIFTRYLAPAHYAFTYGENLFVVLDTNWKDRGQVEWLDKVLGRREYRHRFLFVHKPPFDPRPGRHHEMGDREFAKRLLDTLVRHKVDILFCSHIHSYLETRYKGMKIVVTGGLGAHKKRPIEPFHYVKVEVFPGSVSTKMVVLK